MNDSTALSIIGSRSHSTSSTNITTEKKYDQTTVSATYYFDQFLGLGGIYSQTESDTITFESSYIGIKASYFFTPKFSVTAYHYEVDRPASTLSDYSSTILIANLRF